MINKILVAFFDWELSFIRWALLHKFTTGKDVVDLIVSIRTMRERLVNAHS
jgi:hypothetical protein